MTDRPLSIDIRHPLVLKANDLVLRSCSTPLASCRVRGCA